MVRINAVPTFLGIYDVHAIIYIRYESVSVFWIALKMQVGGSARFHVIHVILSHRTKHFHDLLWSDCTVSISVILDGKSKGERFFGYVNRDIPFSLQLQEIAQISISITSKFQILHKKWFKMLEEISHKFRKFSGNFGK